MKKLLLVLCVLGAVCACSKNKKASSGLNKDLIGVWHLEQISTKAAQIGEYEVDVWLQFEKSKKFIEFQKVGTAGRYEVYKGSLKASKGILSGTFEDGTAFGNWEYEIDQSGDLILTRGGETDYYSKQSEIPEEVIENTY
ncbi:MAG: hypothetical protein IJ686_01405 [Bacteroidales bacterium]|nr:hypothetical protein [Bacteroidales bacterium]